MYQPFVFTTFEKIAATERVKRGEEANEGRDRWETKGVQYIICLPRTWGFRDLDAKAASNSVESFFKKLHPGKH